MGLVDQLVSKYWGVLKDFIKKYTDFLKKPNALALIGAAADKILDGILAYLKDLIKKNLPGLIAAGSDLLLKKIFKDPFNPTDDEIKKYVASHPGLRRVADYASNDLSESLTGDIILACTDPDYPDDLFRKTASSLSIPSESMSGDDFISAVQNISDFDDKVSGYGKTLHNLQDLLKDIQGILPWVFLVYTIVLKVKEWMVQNEVPSKFRGKYISRLIRIASAIISAAAESAKEKLSSISGSVKDSAEAAKQSAKDTAENIKSGAKESVSSAKALLVSLKSIDTVIAALTLAYAIYEKNKKDLQEASTESFEESVSSITCTISPTRPSDFPSPERRELDLTDLSCPISLDDYITPKEPFEDKIENFSCPVPSETVYSPDPQLSSPLAPLLSTRAIFASLLPNSTFSPSPGVTPGSQVSSGDPIFSDGKNLVLSSTSGRVSEISLDRKEIVIDDAKEDPLPVEGDIQNLQDLYRDAIDVDEALDKLYIRTLLPTLIAASPLLDPSIASTNSYRIEYLSGGPEARWDVATRDRKSLKKTYDKDSEDATSEKKIKKAIDNEEDMMQIKKDVDKVKESYYKGIKTLGERAIYQSQRTITDKKSLAMIDWYLLLYDEVLEIRDNSKDLDYKRNTPMEEQISAGAVSPYIITLESKISEIITERIFVDSSTGAGLGTKIGPKYEELCKKLNKGAKNPAIPSPYKSYWEWADAEYKKSLETEKSEKKALNTSSSIISSLGKKNFSLSTEDKNALKYRIFSLFKLIQDVKYQLSKGFSTTATITEITLKEGSFFRSFFDELWKKRAEIPKEIERISTNLQNAQGIYLPSLALRKNGEDFLYYALSEAPDCPPSELPEEISPFTSTDWNDRKYWIKYCSYATLASILVGPAGWGLGIPPPLNIPLPTVYIPIAPLRTSWGVTLIGLTVTGIWIFPFVLVVNQDLLHHVPFLDPVSAIKKEVDTLKKELVNELSEFRKDILGAALKREEDKVRAYEEDLARLKSEKRELQLKEPKRDREKERFGDKVIALREYSEKMSEWVITMESIQSGIVQTKRDKFLTEKKCQLLNRAIRGAKVLPSPDPVISSIEKASAAIDKGFETLDKLLSSIDPILAALPISAKPNKSYFGFTLKNPKPLQEIGPANPELNEELIASIQKGFDLVRDDLMSSTIKAKFPISYLNGKLVAKTVAAAMPVIKTLDPYPPYEKLKPTNVSWSLAYLPKWALAGGGQYGFPGFPKLPI